MVLSTIIAACVLLACTDNITGLRPEALLTQLEAAGPLVVSPANMRGWAFRNDQQGVACEDSTVCRLVAGPAGPPSGTGSAELATSATTDGKALVLQAFQGTRFDAITELRYWTYRQSADAGNNLAIALQVNADYDLADQSTGYQGRLVFEPYHGAGGTVVTGAWQQWDTRAGRWWGTRATVTRNGVSATNPCVQATPCTWAQLLATFPTVGVHATYGAIVLKAGSGWASFRGNVDALTIAVNQTATTYDFELVEPSSGVTLVPPDSVPRALFDSLGTLSPPETPNEKVLRDVIIVSFAEGTPLNQRQAAIEAIGGVVVGGRVGSETLIESYYIRIRGGTHEALVNAIVRLLDLPHVQRAAPWHTVAPDEASYLRPQDGDAWRNWQIDPSFPVGARVNWALEYSRAPMAWGCSTGSSSTSVGVVDLGAPANANIAGNLDYGASAVRTDWEKADSLDWKTGTSRLDHGTRVASVIASVGNDGVGMTGMAWRARLVVRDITKPMGPADYGSYTERLAHNFTAAGRTASVINVSMARPWAGRTYDPNNPAHRVEVTTARNELLASIRALGARRPLFVIAAGNHGQPIAGAGGYSLARDSFPDQVIVVGGLDATGKRWAQSNAGADIYAPAVGVAQASALDSIVRVQEGTSFSAPLVTGVAVLLKDFDPTVTSAQIKSMIIDGARLEDGIRKLDAYGALKLAAQRTGAPLCGNRVYKTTAGIMAQRGTRAVYERSADDRLGSHTDLPR